MLRVVVSDKSARDDPQLRVQFTAARLHGQKDFKSMCVHISLSFSCLFLVWCADIFQFAYSKL